MQINKIQSFTHPVSTNNYHRKNVQQNNGYMSYNTNMVSSLCFTANPATKKAIKGVAKKVLALLTAGVSVAITSSIPGIASGVVASYGSKNTQKSYDPNYYLNRRDEYGNTALIWAAHYGYLDIVKELLEHENIDPYIRDKDGRTALDHNSKLEPLIRDFEKRKQAE